MDHSRRSLTQRIRYHCSFDHRRIIDLQGAAQTSASLAASSTGNYLAFEMQNPVVDTVNKTCGADFVLLQNSGGVQRAVAAFRHGCADGMVMKMAVHGGTVLVWPGQATPMEFQIAATGIGTPGIGAYGTPAGNAISQVQLGAINRVLPAAVDQTKLTASLFRKRVELHWKAALTGIASPGIAGYWVYRDGAYLGRTTALNFWDESVASGETHTYSVVAMDQHFNAAGGTALSLTVPSATVLSPPPNLKFVSSSTAAPHALERPMLTGPAGDSGTGMDPRRIGVRTAGAYWGGNGENIDSASANLNFTLPLLNPQARGGWSVKIALSYNSQNWRHDATGTYFFGQDVGYGTGWKIQAGSLTPVWNSSSFDHWLFTDSTGAEYSLSVNTTAANGDSLWTSVEGVYVTYDATQQQLHFNDGSFWLMQCTSGAGEADTGTSYPTVIEDSNGNQLIITYAPGTLAGGAPNTSARIGSIADSRGPSGEYTFTYDGTEHLTSINTTAVGESYTFNIVGQTLTSPFDGSNWGTWGMLVSAGQTGLPVANQFSYNTVTSGGTFNYSEMTQFTTTLGGSIQWAYRSFTYNSGITLREVQYRCLTATPGVTLPACSASIGPGGPNTYLYTNVHDDGGDAAAGWHANSAIEDMTSGAFRYFHSGAYFSNALVLSDAYAEGDNSGLCCGVTKLWKGYTWTQDSAGNAYTNSVLTALDSSLSITTVTTQTLDTYGNLISQSVWDWGPSPGSFASPPPSGPASRTYNFTYLTDPTYNGKYYVRNRLTGASVTGTSGTITLASIAYDSSLLTDQPGLALHDPNYGTGFYTRGNPTTSYRFGDGSGSSATTTAYAISGIPVLTQKGGVSAQIQTNSLTNYSLPSVITPNSNPNLATNFGYSTSFSLTSVTGPNTASQSVTYDNYGRPNQAVSVDGATTNYTYSFAPTNTQTATIADTGQWVTTTLDGFGRPIRVANGNGSATISQVDTKYAPCGCSPLMKLSATSNPYSPTAGPVWTTYAYDSRGRTISVTAADNVSITTTSYSGPSTSVTDPAGKTKTFTSDAFGNLVQVSEPNPAGGSAYLTTYTYNAVDQLTQVSMPRPVGSGTVTQTRTFAWSDTDLMSATDPETGTTNYQYSNSHLVTQRTDAKGQTTQYAYDNLNRLQYVYHGAIISGSFQEAPLQRVSYFYDSAPVGLGVALSNSTAGRLTAVKFQNQDAANPLTFWEAFDYTIPELARTWLVVNDQYGSQLLATYANYGRDDQGRLTSIAYPTDNQGGGGGTFAYNYDPYGRLSTMTANGNTIYTATYNPAGQVTQMFNNLTAGTETRTYNSLMQVTGISNIGPSMNVTYTFGKAANNGRITGFTDSNTGDNVTYQYDSLNRLISASSSGRWSESYAYDGFGNLTAKTGTGGAPSATLTVDPNTNRPPGYDVNGYPYAPGQFDTEGHQVTNGSGTWWIYDPWGRRIWQETAPSQPGQAVNFSMTFYSATGQRLTEFNGTYTPGSGISYSVARTYQYFGGRLIQLNGTQFGAQSVATDRLGSVRAVVNGDTHAYYPYGEEQGTTAQGQMKFGTYYRDTDGFDYAMARRYGSGTGSFVTPDPVGNAAADKTNPATWNRYLYSGADPVNGRDQTGRAIEYPPGAQDCNDDPDQPGCNDPCQPLPSFELMAGRGLVRAYALEGCEEPEPGPEPEPAPAGAATCSLEVESFPLNTLGFGPDLHASLFFSGSSGYDVIEGFTDSSQLLMAAVTPGKVGPVGNRAGTGTNDGTISNPQVCNALAILKADSDRITGARIPYKLLGPNSSSALRYMLQSLMSLLGSAWYHIPSSLVGYNTRLPGLE